jgi:hypothetical protein
MSGTELIRYDAMCRAIAEAHAVDEVKEIRDKARAIEVYAQQALNTEAEQKACEIRLRAERRCGQLLREMEKAKGARGNPGGQGAPIVRSHDDTAQGETKLSDLGISKQQSSDWQKMAAIPDNDFEVALAVAGGKPTTAGILAAHTEQKQNPVDPRALWLWGRLREFDRELLSEDPNELLATMLPQMQDHTRELAPSVAAWLERITV